MRLHEYVNEILDIVDKQGTKTSEGEFMFLKNVQEGKELFDGATGVDYAALQPNYDELRISGYSFRKALNKNLKAILALRAEGKYDEAKALIN